MSFHTTPSPILHVSEAIAAGTEIPHIISPKPSPKNPNLEHPDLDLADLELADLDLADLRNSDLSHSERDVRSRFTFAKAVPLDRSFGQSVDVRQLDRAFAREFKPNSPGCRGPFVSAVQPIPTN